MQKASGKDDVEPFVPKRSLRLQIKKAKQLLQDHPAVEVHVITGEVIVHPDGRWEEVKKRREDVEEKPLSRTSTKAAKVSGGGAPSRRASAGGNSGPEAFVWNVKEEDGGGSSSRKRRRAKSSEEQDDDELDGDEEEEEEEEDIAGLEDEKDGSGESTRATKYAEVAAENEDNEDEDDEQALRVRAAETELRKYWDRAFESDDTIERIRKGEVEVMRKRMEVPYLAELTGTDMAHPGPHRPKWVYRLQNPLVQAYVNIGRSHDHYIYPLHVDLAGALRANIISRLHASVRFNLEKYTWEVQVFGRNGVEFPAWGWCMPSEYDDEVWRPLRAYANNRFTIGEVEFEIRRNPVFTNDRQMAEYCRALAGVIEKDSSQKSEREYPDESPVLIDLWDALESAEEDVEGKDADFCLDYARTKLSSVPARGTTGQKNPNIPVIEDNDPLDMLRLLSDFPVLGAPVAKELQKKVKREDDPDKFAVQVKHEGVKLEEIKDEDDDDDDDE